MPTYIYETIPQKEGQKPSRFEVKQSMYDAPLSTHPETGQPVQKVIAGSVGIITHSAPAPAPRNETCCGGVGGPDCHCACGDS